MPTSISLERHRLRIVSPNDFSKPGKIQNFLKVSQSLKCRIDAFFMFTPFDFTASTYVTIKMIGKTQHIIELSREDLSNYYWCTSWKKTAIHALILAAFFLIPANKKTGFMLSFSYLMLPPLLSAFLTTKTPLYENLGKTREALNDDLTDKLEQENAIRTRLGNEVLERPKDTRTFKTKEQFLEARATLIGEQSQTKLNDEIQELKKRVGELKKAAREPADIMAFENKLNDLKATDTIAKLKEELQRLETKYALQIRTSKISKQAAEEDEVE